MRVDKIHYQARKNKWLGYFAIFCRITLALGFIPSGMQKILGERFTVLAVNHPMGNFLDAFFHTGYYYTFVGIMQVLAAILLLIPRTVSIGAFIYFPIILNICILSLSVRFDGSQITSPLMVCAVLFLLCWDYHKFKKIFPFNHNISKQDLPTKDELTKKFPFKFFAGVLAVILLVVFHTRIFYTILPRNTLSDCTTQCHDKNDKSCIDFCECIHKEGKSLEKCLEEFDKRN
ncbi:DoxX family protein [uncultured Polaribacter sp.]|uniref:DoxX family protein n=1 Tax=uncultured Polaribacter sp. TaxID=174711 RepID=UPI002621A0DC|nr:DoxX family protein [uncultured Polaribacter sp.]